MRDNYYRLLSEDYSTDWADWQKSIAAYWGFVRLIDDQVGKIWKCLEEENLLGDTDVYKRQIWTRMAHIRLKRRRDRIFWSFQKEAPMCLSLIHIYILGRSTAV